VEVLVLAISFGEAIWLVIISFLFITYLMMLFSIIVDLFRDRELSGVAKALWFIALLFFPIVTAIVYLITRGKGMAERNMKEQVEAKSAFDSYVREVAGGGAASELAQASALLEKGAITQAEFDALKAKILA
jgi:hypothetical protein